MNQRALPFLLVLTWCCFGAGIAAAQQKIRVVTKPVEPFSFTQNGKPAGFSIDLWEAVASEAGFQFEMQSVEGVPQMLDALKSKQADVAIAAISITAERHAMMDFSQPYYDSGLQILVAGNTAANRENFATNMTRQFLNWTTLKVLGLVLLVMFLISHLVWMFERRRNPEMYPEPYGPGVWESFWWTISMLCTGGCEAKGPMGVPARLVAILWMVVSIVLIAYFTAAVTTEMTVKSLAGEISGPGDLPGVKVGTVAGSTAETWLRKNKGKVSSYPDIATAVAALNSGELKAVVYDAPVLRYYLSKKSGTRLRLVGPTFERQSYGIGLQEQSPLRMPINRALLALNERGFIEELQKKWFGASSE
ncbi:MAG TPA: transporter substrate-binding domain-containing protein [Chthoniobacterales bacterium]|nr:transporter substrate-binding domain-containing protein [Chthoniobacterales bacterium]